MAQLPSRAISVKADYSSIKDFEADAQRATKKALEMTLSYFIKELREIIDKDIYNNAYKAKWYERTKWFEDENAIESYIYQNVKDAYGGGIRFSKQTYDRYGDNRNSFQHGNPLKYLEMGSYLAIMNDSSKLHKNPYGFPTNAEIDRGQFYTEFLNKVDQEFTTIFEDRFDRAMGFIKTGKWNLRGLNKGANTSSTGALSSSTQQYKSHDSSKTWEH